MLSGVSGLYIAYYANGGIVAQLGFTGLALSWLYTTSKAYLTIRRKEIDNHRKWMIRSYALTFAAVTLRIWLPMLQYGFGMEFESAYVIIAWLCWVFVLAGISALLISWSTVGFQSLKTARLNPVDALKDE